MFTSSELDVLRRGMRPIIHATLPDVPYFITLTRAHTGKTDVWPLRLQDALPNVPIPLRQLDDDVLLNLGDVCTEVYDVSVNYQQVPPAPALSDEDKSWIRTLLNQA